MRLLVPPRHDEAQKFCLAAPMRPTVPAKAAQAPNSITGVDRLNHIHKALKAQRASGRLTDRQYAQKCRELLTLIGSFDGLIAEAANGTSR